VAEKPPVDVSARVGHLFAIDAHLNSLPAPRVVISECREPLTSDG
jgi:hypothetical protein